MTRPQISTSVSSDDARRGSQQIYEMAQAIGLPSLISRRISELAVSNSEEMKKHITHVLTKADLAQSRITDTTEERVSTATHKTVVHQCRHSTITVKIKIPEERHRRAGENTHSILSITRQSEYITSEVEGLTYGEYEEIIRNVGNNQPEQINVMEDVVNPLNEIYTRGERHGTRAGYSGFSGTMFGHRSEQDGSNWHRRFGDTSHIEEMSDTGKTLRTKPLFEPLKSDFTPMLKIGEQINALKGYENLESVEYDRANNYIRMKTKMIKSGRRKIGEFEILLNLRDQNAVMRRLPNNFFDGDRTLTGMNNNPNNSNIWRAHPFVSTVTKKGFGKICFGDSFSIYQDAIHNGDYFSAANLVLELLVTKTGSPYMEWPNYYKLIDAKADLIDPKKKRERKKRTR